MFERKTKKISHLFSVSLATRSLRNGAEGLGGPLGAKSRGIAGEEGEETVAQGCEGGRSGAAGAAGAGGVFFVAAAAVAVAAAAEGNVIEDVAVEGGTPRTSTWSAHTTARTPSIAKPMARSRMKTVADSAEAEGV